MADRNPIRATIYVLCDSRVADPIARVRYVGQTRIALDRRLYRHWVTATAGAREHRAVWMRAVKAAGGDVLIAEVDRVPFYEADAAETTHVARFRALGCDLTNRTDGGRGKRGWDVSPETRRKMSEAAKRRPPRSPEVCRKIGDWLKADPTHRLHMRTMHQGNRGRTRTPEQRERISQSVRGEKNGKKVMTWDTVVIIRARYAAGAVQSHLAREFKCSPATIHAVVHRLRWVTP